MIIKIEIQLKVVEKMLVKEGVAIKNSLLQHIQQKKGAGDPAFKKVAGFRGVLHGVTPPKHKLH